MEFVLLGFLMIQSLTQYDMHQALSKSVSPFYSPSLGSIQATLKKLEEKGYITVVKSKENGRKKNTYTICDEGRIYFLEWICDDFSEKKFEMQISTRLFFLGLLKKEDRKKVITKGISFLEMQITAYNKENQYYETLKNKSDIITYQLKTLDFAIDYYQNSLKWLKQLNKEMEDMK